MSVENEQRHRLGGEIATLMSGMARTFRAGFVACAAESNLAPAEAQLIWLLDERGDASTGDLAAALGIDPANASTLLTKLEARALVRRVPSERDRRKRVISLTAQGRRTRRSLSSCMESRQPGFAALSTEEMASFRDLLTRVTGAERA
jgi:DNA-binding MarR family transcriptional regulator